MNSLFKLFLILLLMTGISSVSVMAEIREGGKITLSNNDYECEPPYCTHVKSSTELQSFFVTTTSIAPGIGDYSFKNAINPNYRNVSAKANFITADIGVGWTFIDPRTDHFSHTLLLRGNAQTTLIPARIGYNSSNPDGGLIKTNLYLDSELTRDDQTLGLFYKFGVKKHGFTFSVGGKQSTTRLKSEESFSTNASPLDNATIVDTTLVSGRNISADGSNIVVSGNSKVIGDNKVVINSKDVSITGSQVTVPTNAYYNTNNLRLTTKGSFVGFGYDYQINEAQNMRLGANVAYLYLNAKRQLSNPFTGKDELQSSDNAKGIKWGIYLQGDMFKLDRYGRLTYTLSYDNIKYDINFPNTDAVDKVQEKLQTLSFAVNYIFF